MSTRVILNPHAGGCDDAEARHRELARLPGAEIRQTRRPGHGRTLARKAVEAGCRLIVAAGGDGTVHEVVNGMSVDVRAADLGIVPLGTANDFARGLEIPEEPADALEAIRSGASRDVDLVEIRRPQQSGGPDAGTETPGFRPPVHAINMVVGGFGGEVTARVDEEEKRHWGSLAYLRSAIRELGELPRFRARVEVDGRPRERELLNVAVANGPFAGGHVRVAPGARPDDGRLEVILLSAASLGELAGVAARLVAGRPVESDRLERLPGREVSIRSDPPMHFRTDGEQLGAGPLHLRIRPARVRVRVPA